MKKNKKKNEHDYILNWVSPAWAELLRLQNGHSEYNGGQVYISNWVMERTSVQVVFIIGEKHFVGETVQEERTSLQLGSHHRGKYSPCR